MRASEKLRALKPEGMVVVAAPGEGYPDRVLITEVQRDLIADLVQACEEVEEQVENSEWAERGSWLRRPLTALREHLDG